MAGELDLFWDASPADCGNVRIEWLIAGPVNCQRAVDWQGRAGFGFRSELNRRTCRTTDRFDTIEVERKAMDTETASGSQRQSAFVLKSLALAALVGLLCATANAAPGPHSPRGKPGVFPIGSSPYGKTYGEWGAAWWQWAVRFPENVNPVSDTTGAFATRGQSGPVWFVAGTWGGSVQREFSVPTETALFFPLANVVAGAGFGDCTPPNCEVSSLTVVARNYIDTTVVALEAQVDGKEVRDLFQMRAASPAPFPVTFPNGAVFGLPAGTFEPNVCDGYWLMLKPLAEGRHTLHFRATNADGSGVEVTAWITVYDLEKLNRGVLPPDARPYGRSYSEWAAEWWQWAWSIPADQNPVLDTSGVNAAVGQKGEVWFLAGTFGGGTVQRECQVPFGKVLFFPIMNQSWFTGPYDLPPYTDPPLTVPQIRDVIEAIADTFADLACEVDGKAVQHLEAYREQSPVFSATFQENSTVTSPDYPIPAGTYGPCMDDGLYVMLAPLRPGKHTLHFHGTSSYWGITLDTTYELTVVDWEKLNRGVESPYEPAWGKTYGEWSAAWWQWALSLPVTGHPLFDPTGANAATGQSGPVWFLGGTSSIISDGTHSVGQAERTITVPFGKALFFPILNSETDNSGIPPTTLTEAEMRAQVKSLMDQTTDLSCTIDGRLVKGLGDVMRSPYRVLAPLFQFTLPRDNLYQYFGLNVTGPNPPPGGVGDGVYLLVDPLPPGQHTIQFSGEQNNPAGNSYFSEDITYHIMVTGGHGDGHCGH